jgi:nicotinamide riboside kinase
MKKMKKIACIGTHSVGKSTLCYQIAEQNKRKGENVHVIQERVRFSPFPINQAMVYETAIWACTNQISKELEAAQKGFSVIICDRSSFDSFVYAKHYNLTNPSKLEIEKMALEWLKTYDEIYFVRPGDNHQPLEDGVRSVESTFIHDVDQLFDECIKTYSIPVKTLYPKDIFS